MNLYFLSLKKVNGVWKLWLYVPVTDKWTLCIWYHCMTTDCQRKAIKNNAWATMNNDFWVMSEAIFAKKIIANHFASDQKIVIHSDECTILFLTRYFMSWTHDFAQSNYWSLILPLALKTVFSDLALWCHNSWSVTLHDRGVLVLQSHLYRLFFHMQIGAKTIFTSE